MQRVRPSIAVLSLAVILGFMPATGQAQRVGPGGAPPAGSGPVELTGSVRVIDGDTIEAYLGGTRAGIGLIGLDAPMGNTACGRAAIDHLRALLGLAGGAGRGPLRLEEDPDLTFDGRGRRMYYAVSRDGKSVAEEQVKAGVARASGQGRERAALAAAEGEAKAAGRGCLWRGQRAAGASGATRMAMSLGGAEPTGAPAVARLAPLGAALPSGFGEAVVAAGLTGPTAFTFLPDGRILIAEKRGTVRVVKNGAMLATPLIDISDRVNDYWDHGLLGIAADPSFSTNGHVYLLYTYENNEADYSGTKTGRLARYTASGDTASKTSEAVILGRSVGSSCNTFPRGADCLPSDSPSHSVGTLKFAPDGSLFVITGDGAHFNYVDDNALRAQDLDLLSGKLLRITPSGQGRSDNPFWNGSPGANRSKVWASGLRNPYRFNLRPGTDLPYLGDVGWNTWEEVNVGAKGANLGWPCYEGSARQAGYEPKSACQSLYGQGTAAVKMPLLPYNHAGSGAAVTGGAFYTGTTYPAQYRGAYFYGDYSDSWIRYLKVDAGNNLVSGSVADFATGAGGPVAIEAGPDTDLYYLAITTNELRRIRYSAPTADPTSCPVGQYLAQYFNTMTLGGTPTLTRCEAAPITYDWGSGGPGGGIGTDSFSARWAGTHRFAAGDYTFTATADDGIRVWVDGAILIDKWIDQPPTTYTATRALPAGDHQVKVEYYESGGGAVAKLGWQAANQPPTATISTPAATLKFKVGDTIAFSGSATDPEDGTIPASGLAWRVVIKHCPGGQCHDHQLTTAGGTGGSFSAPDHEEDFSLEIALTATDSGGTTGATTVRIQPQTADLTLATSPSGLQVTYNGASYAAPRTFKPIVGGTRTIGAPSPQGGYSFRSWSDGGAQQHAVTVPATATTYTATFASGGGTTCPVGQYLAQYFNNRTLSGAPSGSRCEAGPLNYNWGSGGPGGVGVGADNFSVRWTGTFGFQAASYTFSATADDGIRVWIDGALVIDKWIDQPPTTYTATRSLTAGDHEVRVEYYESGGGAVAKLSWPAAGGASMGAFAEQGGQVVIEAEHSHDNLAQGGKSWTLRTDRAGYAGEGAMAAEPDTGGLINTGYATTSPELRYTVRFNTPGTYHVWLRTYPTDQSNDSAHVGLDGWAVSSADRVSAGVTGSWNWTKSTMDGPVATLSVASVGLHTINVWMREDGFRLDRLLLTTSSSFTPTGQGPPESPRE